MDYPIRIVRWREAKLFKTPKTIQNIECWNANSIVIAMEIVLNILDGGPTTSLLTKSPTINSVSFYRKWTCSYNTRTIKWFRWRINSRLREVLCKQSYFYVNISKVYCLFSVLYKQIPWWVITNKKGNKKRWQKDFSLFYLI